MKELIEKSGSVQTVLILGNSSGGIYNFRFELVEKLLEEGYKVYFCVPETKNNRKVQFLINIGAKYIHTPINRRGMNPFEDLKLIKKYKEVVKKTNPSIILTYTIKPNIYGVVAAKILKKPIIMNITGIGYSLTYGKFKYIIKKLYKFACRNANYVFFQNESNHSFFINNELVNNRKTKILPGSGVNLRKFIPLEKSSNDDVVRFMFIGRVMKEKGIEEYLEVAKKIIKKYKNTEFHILGNIQEERYKKVIENCKESKIIYRGVSLDVRNEIREVDCIVNPSHHEGMSNTLLEAGAMGKPLIASNIPGCKEIIDDGKNGFLFEVKSVADLEEKIIQFLELDVNVRKLMGRKSREKISKEFDRNIIISEYLKVINKYKK